MAQIRLYGPDGVATVRTVRTVADAPASGLWNPDNLNADEIAGSVVADDVTLDALQWDNVRLVAIFSGSPLGSELVEVEPLIAVPDPSDPINSRTWATLSKFTLSPELDTDIAEVTGHSCAFRMTSLNLNGATDVTLQVTGGIRRRLD